MNDARYADFRTDVNLDQLPAGSQFAAVWRVRNSGTTTWGPDFQIVHIHADRGSWQLAERGAYTLADVASRDTVAPGTDVDIRLAFTAPESPFRRYFSDWILQAPDGSQFGEILWLRLVTAKPAEPPRSGFLKSDSRFVDDHTIPDGTMLEEETPFTKQWVVSNTGQRKWNDGYRLVFVAGDANMTGAFSVSVPAAAPGDEVVLAVDMVSPPTRAEPYLSSWRIFDDRNIPFGDTFWVKMFATPRADGSSIKPFSQNDPRWKDTQLGFGPKTIGQFGCLMTCYAMMLTGYGEDIDPARFNQAALGLSENGFVGSNIFFVTPALLYDHVIYFGNHKPREETGADFAAHDPRLIERIDQMLASNQGVIIQVDSQPANAYNPTVEQHWVLVAQRRGGDYIVIDPLDGQRVSLLSRYGRQSRPQDPDDDLRDAIKSTLFFKSTASAISFSAVSFADVDSAAGSDGISAIGAADELAYTGPRWPFNRTLVGIHDRADRHPQPADHKVVRGRFESVKIQSGITVPEMRGYGAEFYLCRLFESFNGRDLPVAQFVDAVLPDIEPLVRAGVTYFEFHNEPNLTHEGLAAQGGSGSWRDGAGFADYFLRGRALLQAKFPQIKVGFPGLSPGGDAAYQFGHDQGFRMDDQLFLEEAWPALQAADFIGIHAYYLDLEELRGKAIGSVRRYRERWPDKLLFVTEFSNPGAAPPQEKGQQAREFYRLVGEIPGVGAAYYFIVSGAGWDSQALRAEGDRFNVVSTGIVEAMF